MLMGKIGYLRRMSKTRLMKKMSHAFHAGEM
jgi:hypothetical protein